MWLLFVLLIVMLLIHWRDYWVIHAVPAPTIRRVMGSVLTQLEQNETMTSPYLAFLQVRECQTALQTLIQVVGGHHDTLDLICHVNVAQLQNLLHAREHKLRACLEHINEHVQ